MYLFNVIILSLFLNLAGFSGILAQSSVPDIDPVKLETLKQEAERTNSDAVVIYRHGTLVAEWYFGKEPKTIETMSAYKSIVSLAVGRLLKQQMIDSLDQPVYTLYPEWNQGQKKLITIRHLLNHTSGLQNKPNAGAEIYPAPDAIRLALAAELDYEPGTRFAYNNKAVNLLSGIIEKASGMKMDEYLRKEFFSRMNIEEYSFYYDQAGNPHAMAGLQLHALDVAKFGLLVLNDGIWNGEQIIDPEYIRAMVTPGQELYPFSGLLWWLLPEYSYYEIDSKRLDEFRQKGIPGQIIDKLKPVSGKRFETIQQRNQAKSELLGNDWTDTRNEYFKPAGFDQIFHHEYGEIKAWYADGYLGQFIVVVPETSIVAVRQIANFDDFDFGKDNYTHFRNLILELVSVPF